MGLENIHPTILTRVKAQLPAEAVITGIAAVTAVEASFTVEYKEQTRSVRMPKVDINQLFDFRIAEVTATEGEPLKDVVARLSAKYELYLVDGTDYDVGAVVVAFNGQSTYRESLTVLYSSVSLFGSFAFTVTDKNKVARPTCKLVVNLDEERLKLALASYVFDGKGKVFASGKLSKSFSKTASAHVGGLGLPLTLSAGDLADAEVLDDVHDGISRLCIIKTPAGVILPVRYKTTAADTVAFKVAEEA